MKLSNEIRNNIIKALIKHRFAADQEAIDQREASLADKLYCDYYGAATRKQMDKMPDGALPVTRDTFVTFAGCRDTLKFSSERRCFYIDRLGGSTMRVAKYDAHHAYTLEWHALENARKDLKERKSQAANKAEAVLKSVGSSKRLLEIWPEVEPFLPPEPAKVQLPATITQDLNKALDLPVAEAA
ncbi:Nmad5 family putative nucleotide modification protein [Thalassospira povalilytica]|uniref:Nmad5 family putative nucleotide modification protein n=1 Tax=Thalassospira povalilytica TaxID=732237 RepID=UPI003AA9388E